MGAVRIKSENVTGGTYSNDPCRGPLLTPKHPLCANHASRWIYSAVDDIHRHNMGTVGIGVLVPHPNDDMRPRVTTER
jgi:hypothetical protein